MKLLFDQNLSFRLAEKVADLFPGSAHVRDFGLTEADDEKVWEFAKDHEFVIVSKDRDFLQRSLVDGHPPRLILLEFGNCSTARIEMQLRTRRSSISAFGRKNKSILILRDGNK